MNDSTIFAYPNNERVHPCVQAFACARAGLILFYLHSKFSSARSGPNECMYKTITMCVRFVHKHQAHGIFIRTFLVRFGFFTHLLFDVLFLFGRLASTKISHNIIMSAINVVQQLMRLLLLLLPLRTYNVHLCGVFASSSIPVLFSTYFVCVLILRSGSRTNSLNIRSEFEILCVLCNGVWLIRANSTDI